MQTDVFILKYQNEENIADIDWQEFPEKLQEAGLKFMNRWKEELPIKHLRVFSGFDDMTVNDLVEYASRVERGSFTRQEVYSYTEWAIGNYHAKNGEVYQVTLTRSYDKNIGIEHRLVLNIQNKDIDIPETDPIWKEVKFALEK